MPEHIKNEERISGRWPKVKSSKGFTVRVLGRTGTRYAEGDRSVRIDSEIMDKPGRGAIVLYPDSIVAWERPNESDELTAADRERIVGNIKRAFEARGIELVLQEDQDWRRLLN